MEKIHDLNDLFSIIINLPRSGRTVLRPVKSSYGYICAEDTLSLCSYPPYPVSRMDGFAYKRKDENAESFRIIADLSAADRYSGNISTRECVRIATGAQIPEDADAVIPVENTEEDEGFMSITEQDGRSHIEKAGSHFREGEKVIKKGRKVDHRDIETMISAGLDNIRVYEGQTVGIISTGSEITSDINSEKIANSNYYMLASLLESVGIEYKYYGIVPDEGEIIEKALSLASQECDCIVTFGGTAMSRYDLLLSSAENLGGEILTESINASPGRTFKLALVENVPVFMVPGKPAAATVCCELFLMPYLQWGVEKNFAFDVTESAFSAVKKTGFYRLMLTETAVENGRLITYERCSCPSNKMFKSISIIDKDTGELQKGASLRTMLISYL